MLKKLLSGYEREILRRKAGKLHELGNYQQNLSDFDQNGQGKKPNRHEAERVKLAEDSFYFFPSASGVKRGKESEDVLQENNLRAIR